MTTEAEVQMMKAVLSEDRNVLTKIIPSKISKIKPKKEQMRL